MKEEDCKVLQASSSRRSCSSALRRRLKAVRDPFMDLKYIVYILTYHWVHKQSQGTLGVKEEACKVFLIRNGEEVIAPAHAPFLDHVYMVCMIWYHRVHKQSQGTFAVKEEDCKVFLIVNCVGVLFSHV